jgi:hypothetical protein
MVWPKNMANVLTVTTFVRSTKAASNAMVRPVAHTAKTGVACRSAMSWVGKSPRRAIAYTIREMPRIEVRSTLAIATRPPADTA